VTLTGCLQQGNHGAYILTELNEPSTPDSSNPGVVASERTAAAEHAYRLSSTAHDTDLAKLVGNKVRVEGTETQASEVPAVRNEGRDATGSTSTDRADKATAAERIQQGDLAQVEVNAVQKVADACGGRTDKGRQSRG